MAFTKIIKVLQKL